MAEQQNDSLEVLPDNLTDDLLDEARAAAMGLRQPPLLRRPTLAGFCALGL